MNSLKVKSSDLCLGGMLFVCSCQACVAIEDSIDHLTFLAITSLFMNLTELKWYCLKCQPRMEAVATAHLRNMDNVEVFYPQTTLTKKTKEGKVTLKKPLFPSYIFCSFDPTELMRAVNYSQGVSYVVSHGTEPVEVPDLVIQELTAISDEGVLPIPSARPEVGQSVKVLHGLFEGKEGTVIKLVPEKQRIHVLFEILGAISKVEVEEDFVDAGDAHPMTIR